MLIWLVIREPEVGTLMFEMRVGVWIMDEEGGKEESVKAQVSITCVPWVFIIFIVLPVGRGMAMPWRAGMVVREDIFELR
jgi:hypothetical protein